MSIKTFPISLGLGWVSYGVAISAAQQDNDGTKANMILPKGKQNFQECVLVFTTWENRLRGNFIRILFSKCEAEHVS